MRHLGDGEPEIAVVGGIHGDEPCGVNAVETLLDEDSFYPVLMSPEGYDTRLGYAAELIDRLKPRDCSEEQEVPTP